MKGLNMQPKSDQEDLCSHGESTAEKFSLSVEAQTTTQASTTTAELGLNALMCKNAIVLDLVVNKAVKRRQKISFSQAEKN